MDQNLQLKLQAWLDGELADSEAREVQTLVASNPEAQDLVRELSATRSAFKAFEKTVTLPESREFYWSKIQRQISQTPPAPRPAQSVHWLEAFRRAFVPLTSVAVVVVLGLIAAFQFGLHPHSMPQLDSAMEDPAAFTYRDFSSGTTLVWLSFPAEKGLARDSSADTLP